MTNQRTAVVHAIDVATGKWQLIAIDERNGQVIQQVEWVRVIPNPIATTELYLQPVQDTIASCGSRGRVKVAIV